MMISAAVLCTVVLADAAIIQAGSPHLKSAPESSPGVRNAHAAVYLPRDSALVLFGGATDREVRADTWRWHAGEWRRGPAGPGPRTFPAMAYDSARDEIVLFGGSRVLFGDSARSAALLADTWLLRDGGWVRASTDGPPPRAEAAIGYDPRRRRTVLFGGRLELPGGTVGRLSDTWEWDGERWTRMSTEGPSPRSGAAMAYHPGLRAVVLFGGSGGPLGDTWSWNGHAWGRLSLPAAAGRFNTVMAWDPAAQRLVRFGGWDGKQRTFDTWELVDSGWVQAHDTGPSPRNHAVLVSAPDRASVMLYGGHDGEVVFGDLWERRAGRWTLLESAIPRRRVPNDH